MSQLMLLAEATGENPTASTIQMVVLFFIIFFIWYFLVIKPQRKKETNRQAMVNGLKKNDRVLTIGGILGRVVAVRDEDVILKIDENDNVRVKFAKNAIVNRISDEKDVNPEKET